MDLNVEVVKHLENDLQLGRVRNPSYSMRSLSKRIGVTPSALSALMNGKRKVTQKMAFRILSSLNIDASERDRLLNRILPNSRKGRATTNGQPNQTLKYAEIDLRRSHVVLDWFNFAIVSLAQTADFNEDPQWIAKRLGIHQATARTALRSLEQVGLLIRDREGKLKHSSMNFATPSDIPDYSIRKRHHQQLDLAIWALDEQDVLERDFSSMTIATTGKKLAEAKERIKRFRRELCAFLESDEKEEVFLLNIQLFPVTQRGTP